MKIKLVKFDYLANWYTIERADHANKSWLEEDKDGNLSSRYSGRIGDADVEGPAGEMVGIAEAIRKRGKAEYKRCAVEVFGKTVEFWSPRNSRRRVRCSIEEADELASQIERELP